MKPELRQRIICPACGGDYADGADQWVCQGCGRLLPFQDETPLFSPVPQGMVSSQKIARGPDLGTPWRQANWRFLEQQVSRCPSDAVFLDVGAGRGDFAAIFNGRPYLALEVYPYPEVDLVCDLTCQVPFRPASFDGIVLMNVLEHVYDGRAMLATLAKLLKPGGVLLVAVPFLLKIHQAPYDFARYTGYSLERLGCDAGLQVESLEGYYDPAFVLGEGLRNLYRWTLPGLPALRRRTARVLLALISALAGCLARLVGPGQVMSPDPSRSPAMVGYHVVYRKPVKDGV